MHVMSTSDTPTKRFPLHIQILLAMIVGTIIGVLVNPGDVAVDTPIEVTLETTDACLTLK